MPDLHPGASAPEPTSGIIPTGSSSANSSSFEYESNDLSTSGVAPAPVTTMTTMESGLDSSVGPSATMLPPSSIAVGTSLGALGSARLSEGCGVGSGTVQDGYVSEDVINNGVGKNVELSNNSNKHKGDTILSNPTVVIPDPLHDQIRLAIEQLQLRSRKLDQLLQQAANAARQTSAKIDRRELDLKIEIESLARQEKAAALDWQKQICRPLWPLKSQCDACLMQFPSGSEPLSKQDTMDLKALLSAIEPTLEEQLPGETDFEVEHTIPNWRLVIAPPEREVVSYSSTTRRKDNKRPQSSKSRKHKREPLTLTGAAGEEEAEDDGVTAAGLMSASSSGELPIAERTIPPTTKDPPRSILSVKNVKNGSLSPNHTNHNTDTTPAASSWAVATRQAQHSFKQNDHQDSNNLQKDKKRPMSAARLNSASGSSQRDKDSHQLSQLRTGMGNATGGMEETGPGGGKYLSVSLLQGNAGLLNTSYLGEQINKRTELMRPQSSKARKHKRVKVEEEDELIPCDTAEDAGDESDGVGEALQGDEGVDLEGEGSKSDESSDSLPEDNIKGGSNVPILAPPSDDEAPLTGPGAMLRRSCVNFLEYNLNNNGNNGNVGTTQVQSQGHGTTQGQPSQTQTHSQGQQQQHPSSSHSQSHLSLSSTLAGVSSRARAGSTNSVDSHKLAPFSTSFNNDDTHNNAHNNTHNNPNFESLGSFSASFNKSFDGSVGKSCEGLLNRSFDSNGRRFSAGSAGAMLGGFAAAGLNPSNNSGQDIGGVSDFAGRSRSISGASQGGVEMLERGMTSSTVRSATDVVMDRLRVEDTSDTDFGSNGVNNINRDDWGQQPHVPRPEQLSPPSVFEPRGGQNGVSNFIQQQHQIHQGPGTSTSSTSRGRGTAHFGRSVSPDDRASPSNLISSQSHVSNGSRQSPLNGMETRMHQMGHQHHNQHMDHQHQMDYGENGINTLSSSRDDVDDVDGEGREDGEDDGATSTEEGVGGGAAEEVIYNDESEAGDIAEAVIDKYIREYQEKGRPGARKIGGNNHGQHGENQLQRNARPLTAQGPRGGSGGRDNTGITGLVRPGTAGRVGSGSNSHSGNQLSQFGGGVGVFTPASRVVGANGSASSSGNGNRVRGMLAGNTGIGGVTPQFVQPGASPMNAVGQGQQHQQQQQGHQGQGHQGQGQGNKEEMMHLQGKSSTTTDGSSSSSNGNGASNGTSNGTTNGNGTNGTNGSQNKNNTTIKGSKLKSPGTSVPTRTSAATSTTAPTKSTLRGFARAKQVKREFTGMSGSLLGAALRDTFVPADRVGGDRSFNMVDQKASADRTERGVDPRVVDSSHQINVMKRQQSSGSSNGVGGGRRSVGRNSNGGNGVSGRNSRAGSNNNTNGHHDGHQQQRGPGSTTSSRGGPSPNSVMAPSPAMSGSSNSNTNNMHNNVNNNINQKPSSNPSSRRPSTISNPGNNPNNPDHEATVARQKDVIKCYLSFTDTSKFYQVRLPHPSATVGDVIRMLGPKLGGGGKKNAANNSKLTLCLKTHEEGTPIWLCHPEGVKTVLDDWASVSETDWPRLFLQVER